MGLWGSLYHITTTLFPDLDYASTAAAAAAPCSCCSFCLSISMAASLPFSWPQPPSMSMPRRMRTVAGMP